MKKIILYLLSMLTVQDQYAQVSIKPLSRGASMPEIEYQVEGVETIYNTKDWKGKVIILDFWGVRCKSCIEMMPKLEDINAKLAGNVSVIAITTDSDMQVSKLFEKLKMKRPALAFVNSDSIFSKLFPYEAIPHYVIIGPDGKVHSITYAHNVTQRNVVKILKGELVTLALKDDLIGFDASKPLATEGGGRVMQHSIRYSILFHRLEGYSGNQLLSLTDTVSQTASIKVINAPLLELYKFAYSEQTFLGDFRFDNRVVLSTRDTARFTRPANTDQWDQWYAENSYCFELRIPLGQKAKLFAYFREELNKLFGYDVSVEVQPIKCYALQRLENYHRDKVTDKVRFSKKHLVYILNTKAQENMAPIIFHEQDESFYIERLESGDSFHTVLSKIYRSGYELCPIEMNLPMLIIRDKNIASK